MASRSRASGEAPGARLSDADYQALGAFRLAVRKFLAFSAAGAEAMDLTPQQHQALLAIRAHTGPEAMTIGELADSLLIKNHSAVGLVARLVERGLVERRASDIDRRRVILTVTPPGLEKLEIISRNNLGELARASAILDGLLETIRNVNGERAPSPDPK